MRWILRAALSFALIIGGFVGAERLVVYPLDPRVEDPGDHDLPTVTARMFDTGGTQLMIWTSPPAPGKPTILYLHGNAGNLADRASRFRSMTKRGYGLVAPGYRGSSGSEGWPREKAILRDIEAVYAALISGDLTGTSGPPIIYGESIGAAVAIQLNARLSSSSEAKAALAIILEAPFTSLQDVARDLWPELQLLTGLMMSRWRSEDFASRLIAPLLVLHGSNDQLIPIAQGRAIFDAAQSELKTFYEVEGAGHVDVLTLDAQEQLYRFMSQF